MSAEGPDWPNVDDPDAPTHRTAHVLLLDDEGDFTSLLTTILEARGFLVTVVNNAADGIKSLMNRDFDGIVCDMRMPGLPGDVFYLAVERTKPHLCKRFIFITGQTDDHKINQFLERSGARVLHKPFPSQALIDALRSVISGTRT